MSHVFNAFLYWADPSKLWLKLEIFRLFIWDGFHFGGCFIDYVGKGGEVYVKEYPEKRLTIMSLDLEILIASIYNDRWLVWLFWQSNRLWILQFCVSFDVKLDLEIIKS